MIYDNDLQIIAQAGEMMQSQLVSQYLKSGNGKWRLEVEGAPFLFHCMQGRALPGGPDADCFEAAAGLGYKTLTVWVHWADIEPKRGDYRFDAVDKLISLAERYKMRLDILWSGADFAGSPFLPPLPGWLLRRHEPHVKPDPSDEELFQAEYKALKTLVCHLRDKDKTKRVISLQLEHEYDSVRYAAPAAGAVIYTNRLAGEIKALDNKIALRVNISARDDFSEPSRDKLSAEPSAYLADIQFSKQMLRSGDAARFRYSEEDPINDAAAHIAEALACGAFYSRYIPGSGKSRADTSLADLNRSLSGAGEVIVLAEPDDMRAFNSKSVSLLRERYNKEIVLRGRAFALIARDESAAAGLIAYHEEYFYIFTGGDAVFCLPGEPKEACSGTYNNGVWQVDGDKLPDCRGEDGKFILQCRAGECVRITFEVTEGR
jgi:hypothetical protein